MEEHNTTQKQIKNIMLWFARIIIAYIIYRILDVVIPDDFFTAICENIRGLFPSSDQSKEAFTFPKDVM